MGYQKHYLLGYFEDTKYPVTPDGGERPRAEAIVSMNIHGTTFLAILKQKAEMSSLTGKNMLSF